MGQGIPYFSVRLKDSLRKRSPGCQPPGDVRSFGAHRLSSDSRNGPVYVGVIPGGDSLAQGKLGPLRCRDGLISGTVPAFIASINAPVNPFNQQPRRAQA